jgi:hypothetical protein
MGFASQFLSVMESETYQLPRRQSELRHAAWTDGELPPPVRLGRSREPSHVVQ